MSEELENELRAALRPVDPGERFTRQVMSRVAALPRPPAHAWARMSQPALAASVLLALAGAGLWQAHQLHRAQEGREARVQLLQALRVTGRQLDVAYRAVNTPRRPFSNPSGT